MKSKKIFKENNLLLVIYTIVFFYLIFQNAIYSPDTPSYLIAQPYRHLGYVIFVKAVSYIFVDYFDLAVKVFQTLFCFAGIHFFFKKITQLLQLSFLLKSITLIILLFPLFQPLYVANNICPEGISYPLYLIFVTLNLEFLFNDNSKVFKYIVACFLALVFTRGQFMFTELIFALVYITKFKKQLFKIKILSKLLVLILLPIVVVLGEMSYHKLKDGIFMTTPFGFINTSTSAFYVSNRSDIQLISNKDDRAFFKSCFNLLAEQKLLLSQNKAENYKLQYNHYEKHLTTICNRTIHVSGKEYYLQKSLPTSINDEFAYAKAYYDIDQTCKNLTFILIKQNFKKWIQLYFANIIHGFNHWIILIAIVIAFIFSFFKLILNFNKWHALLFIFSGLSILNAAVIALFTYSIPRLVFYNYTLLFLSFIIMIKLLKEAFNKLKTKA